MGCHRFIRRYQLPGDRDPGRFGGQLHLAFASTSAEGVENRATIASIAPLATTDTEDSKWDSNPIRE
jgi:hypothetical protein